MTYEIIHAIEGRIRVRVPILADDEEDYTRILQTQLASLKFVTDIRINPQAQSIVITYRYKAISSLEMQKYVSHAIEQALTKQTEPTVEKTAANQAESPAKAEPNVSEEESLDFLAGGIIQQFSGYTASEVNLDEDPWSDGTTKTIENQPEQEIRPKIMSATGDDKLGDENQNSQVENAVTNPVLQINLDEKELRIPILAKRLGVSNTILNKHKFKLDFGDWSKSKDPDGIAWKYIHSSKLFYPLFPDTSESQK